MPRHRTRIAALICPIVAALAFIPAVSSRLHAADGTRNVQEIVIEARTLTGPEKDLAKLTAGIKSEPFLTPPGEVVQTSATQEPKDGGPQTLSLPFRKAVLTQPEALAIVEAAQAHERINLMFVPKLTTRPEVKARISLGKTVLVGVLPGPDGKIQPVEREIGHVISVRPSAVHDEKLSLKLDCEQSWCGPMKKMQGFGPDGKAGRIEVPDGITTMRCHTTCDLTVGQSVLLTGFTHREGKKSDSMAILLTVTAAE